MMSDKKAQLWEQKSKTFPRYSKQLSTIQTNAFKACKAWGVEFSGKKIIDIGCGTGVWTLHLAQKASQISALDSSAGMLEILQETQRR